MYDRNKDLDKTKVPKDAQNQIFENKNKTNHQDRFGIGWSHQLENMKAPNGSGPGVRRSKRFLWACHIRRRCSMTEFGKR